MSSGENEIAQEKTNKRGIVSKTIFGEWRREKYVPFVAACLCFIDAFVTAYAGPDPSMDHGMGALRTMIRDGAFHSALLFIALFYLSEARYKLFPEVRND